jgi:hypothetical protein
VSKYGNPNENPDLYYSHGIELRGITGEFFEALINEFRENIKITAYCREMQGVHYPSDNKASIIFTESIFDQLHKILG